MQVGDISDYVAAILVIIGWVILYRQSLALKRREEIQSSVRLATDTISSLLDLCTVYYDSSNKSHISYVSAQIKGEFHLLSRYLLLLKTAGLQLEATARFVEFKMLATGSHFETVAFLKQLSIPDWQQKLTFSGLELRYLVERAYFDWSNQKLNTKALLLP